LGFAGVLNRSRSTKNRMITPKFGKGCGVCYKTQAIFFARGASLLPLPVPGAQHILVVHLPIRRRERMKIGDYQFHCTLQQDAILPPYKGSTFRGGFGSALKQTLCALRRQDCPVCLLRETCLYARVFEAQSPAASGARLAARPHPYVIRPAADTRTRMAAGDSFNFTLLLFGQINEALPYFVYAFDKMGQNGVGKGRAKFVLDRVSCKGQILYRQGSTRLESCTGLEALQLPVDIDAPPADIHLNLQTPLRVKHQGHFVQKLDFSTLMRTALRRLSSVMASYGDGEPELPYRELIQQAQQIPTLNDQTRWHDWQRYSNRQQEAMQFGGLVGEICFGQVPARQRQLLCLAARLHLGKQTSFGLGQIAVEPP